MVLIVFMYALLASTFTIAKQTLAFAKPCFLIALRMLIAGGLLLSYEYFVRGTSLRLPRVHWWLFLKAALFHIYLSYILEFFALSNMSSSKVTIIYSITPFIAALLAYLLDSEQLSTKKVVAMVLGFVGLTPVFLAEAAGEGAEFFSLSRWEVVLLGAVFCGSYAWFIVKELINRGYSLVMINGFAMLIGGLGALVTSLAVEGVQTSPIYDPMPFFLWLTLLILMANIIVYNFYGWLIKKYSITTVTVAGFTCPIFGAFFGWYFLDELITWHYGVSLVVVTCALYLFFSGELHAKSS